MDNVKYFINCPIHKNKIPQRPKPMNFNGTEIPIFYCEICDKYYINQKGNKKNYAKHEKNPFNTEVYYTLNSIKKEIIEKKGSNKGQSKKEKKKKKKTSSSKSNRSNEKNVVRMHVFENGNDKQKLENILKRIKIEYPLLIGKKIDINDFIMRFFSTQINHKCCVRNMSYNGKNGSLIKRAEIYTKKEKGKNSLPDDSVLIFSGYLKNGEFVVDDIKINEHPVKKVDDHNLTLRFTYDGPNAQNALYDYLNKAAQNSQLLSDEIAYWNEYLDWKRELAELRVKGLKYIAYQLDFHNREVVFLIVSEGYKGFDDFKKYLKRNEVSIFSNNFSNDRYMFELNKETKENNQNEQAITLNFIEVSKSFKKGDIDPENWNEWFNSSRHYGNKDRVSNFSELMLHIENKYDYPVFHSVTFEMNSETSDFLDRQIKRNGYISYEDKQKVANSFYFDGFIATSLIGDFTLNNRLKHAIDNLVNGKSVSDGLEKWIFDIKQAREPDKFESITFWQNDRMNDSQKNAVKKILSAPDVCLIQGPPGTGKTTVIAEAVYQLVVRNKRVLISSQANLAVDNALERLISNPMVRAIRLGNTRKIDLSVNNITENNILESFYGSIRNHIYNTYVKEWDAIDEKMNNAKEDINKYLELEKVIEDLNDKISNLNNEINVINLIEKNNYVPKISKLELYIEELSNLKDNVESANYSLDFNFNQNDGLMILDSLNSKITDLKNKGIILLSVNINQNSSVELLNYAIREIIKNTFVLYQIYDRFTNKETLLLEEKKLKEAQLKVDFLTEQFMIVGSPEITTQYRRALQELQNLKNKSNSLLDEELLLFNHLDDDKSPEIVVDIIEKCKMDLVQINQEIKKRISCLIHSYKEEMNQLIKENQDIQKKCEEYKLKINSFITEKEKYLQNQNIILSKYNAAKDTFVNEIENLQKNSSLEENSKIDRTEWEDIFRGLTHWIDSIPDYIQENDIFLKDFINGCNVVGVSCTENTRTLEENGFSDFDVVIIDEVSKATPPELLIPMLKGKKIVLVGDHRQLPPLFNEHEKTYQEVIESIDTNDEESKILTMDNFNKFKDMVTSSLFENYFENSPESIKETLLSQYRMHEDIMDIVNLFYDGRLIDGNEDSLTKEHHLKINSINGTAMIQPENHAYWFDSSELDGRKIYEQRREGSTSAENLLEAHIIIELLKKMDLEYANSKKSNRQINVGVISFYYDQVLLIRNLLKNELFHTVNIDVNTVDRFQGKEKEIVFVSLVRNTQKQKLNVNSHIAAFQRINVAFSRAQNMLVIVGAKDMYVKQPVKISNMNNGTEKVIMAYKEIIEMLDFKGAFFTSDDIINESLADEILNKTGYGGNI